jgi:hypothetical protein
MPAKGRELQVRSNQQNAPTAWDHMASRSEDSREEIPTPQGYDGLLDAGERLVWTSAERELDFGTRVLLGPAIIALVLAVVAVVAYAIGGGIREQLLSRGPYLAFVACIAMGWAGGFRKADRYFYALTDRRIVKGKPGWWLYAPSFAAHAGANRFAITGIVVTGNGERGTVLLLGDKAKMRLRGLDLPLTVANRIKRTLHLELTIEDRTR